MDVKILESTKESLKLRVTDEDHTLLNPICEELSNMNETRFAGYSKDHILMNKSSLNIKGKDPKKLLVTACKNLIKELNTIKK